MLQKSMTFSDGNPSGEKRRYDILLVLDSGNGERRCLQGEAETNNSVWLLEQVVNSCIDPSQVHSAILRSMDEPHAVVAAYTSANEVVSLLIPKEYRHCEGFYFHGRRILLPQQGFFQRVH